jgi:cytochrome c-type biogenesis protein CcmE
MKRKLYYVLGAALLIGFAGFSLAAFKTSLTPYVSFAEATRAGGRVVQVAGGLDQGSANYDQASSSLRFTLVDPATQAKLKVRYEGVRPANFDEAISIVAIGHYDGAATEFEAAKLLVKCPSKYQGAEVTKTY